MKKTVVKIFPHLVLITLSVIFLLLGIYLNEQTAKSLFINMAATSIYIFIAIITFDIAKYFSKKELNKEVFHFAESKIDNDIFAILLEITKILNEEKVVPNIDLIGQVHNLNKTEIKEKLSKRKYLGFSILKNWTTTERYFDEILSNAFILNQLEDGHILIIVKLINSLRNLEYLMQSKGFLTPKEHNKNKMLKIIKGTEINPENNIFPNRYLLLEQIGTSGKAVVKEFGDFADLTNREVLLDYFVINENKLDSATESISNILLLIKEWLRSTDNGLSITLPSLGK